jgi:hypothetical protein
MKRHWWYDPPVYSPAYWVQFALGILGLFFCAAVYLVYLLFSWRRRK